MDRLDRYARLLLGVGANLQPGQPLLVVSDVAHIALVRAVAAEAWRMGASQVDVLYEDAHLHRAKVELAPDAALSASPDWMVAMLDSFATRRGAVVRLRGDPAPDLLEGLDSTRVGSATMKAFNERWRRAVGYREVAWTIGGAPVEGWARRVFGEPDVDPLWSAVEVALRLDEPDPVAAWEQRLRQLAALAMRLTERRFDALRYRGPGTDLTVGLLPSGVWVSAGDFETSFGQRHVPNLPTEEVFTSPDRRRAEGTIRASRPLGVGGTAVEGLEFDLRGGRITEVRARGEGADLVRAILATDEGAAHLGELALVDGSSRVGRSGLLFWETLFDENAACHIAFGSGFRFCVGSEGELTHLNASAIHVDFMVGSADLEVDGIEPGGSMVPILRDNSFQL